MGKEEDANIGGYGLLNCPGCGSPCEITGRVPVISEYYTGTLVTVVCGKGCRFQGDVEDIFRSVVHDWDREIKELHQEDV